MKLLTALLFLTIALNCSPPPPPLNLKQDISIKEIQENTWLVSHNFKWPSNSLLLKINENQALIIDTPYTPAATQVVLNFIKNKLNLKKVLAINTHYHIDRTGGNQVLRHANIDIISSHGVAQEMKKKAQWSLNMIRGSLKKAPDYLAQVNTIEITPPNRLFQQQKDFSYTFAPTKNYEKETFTIQYIGHGHSADNLVVYLPKRKILFAGCAVFAAKLQKVGNMSDANAPNWVEALRNIRLEGMKTVIPGHGDPGPIGLVQHTIDILNQYLNEQAK